MLARLSTKMVCSRGKCVVSGRGGGWDDNSLSENKTQPDSITLHTVVQSVPMCRMWYLLYLHYPYILLAHHVFLGCELLII